jgi:hypothetical protein
MFDKLILKKFNLIFILILLINLGFFVSADCMLTGNLINVNPDYEISGDDIIFELETNPGNIIEETLSFTKSDCDPNSVIVLKLMSDLNFKLSGNTNQINITGDVDILELNDYFLDIDVSNNAIVLNSTFKIDVPLVRLSSGTSQINIHEIQRTPNLTQDCFSIRFEFSDLEICENSNLDIIVDSADGVDHTSNNDISGSGREELDYINSFKNDFNIDFNKDEVENFIDPIFSNWNLLGDGRFGSEIYFTGNNILNNGN